jgi:MFS family permease
MNIEKLIRPVSFGIVFLALLVFMVMIFGEDQDVVKVTKDSKAVGVGFILTYILFAIALVAVVGMAVNGLRNKPKSAIIMAIGFGAIALFYFIGYAADSGEVTESFAKGGIITTETDSKMVGGILNATLIILLLTVAISVVSSIKDIINKLNG